MTEAIIYTRFSPRPDANESESGEKQEQACRAYCARRGYHVEDVIPDNNLSGDDADRKGLWAAIEALRRGSVLVVRWRNRLARDVYLSEVIKRAVAKAGARIEAAEENNNGESADDVFIQQILAAFAEREKKVTALRTKHAMLRYQKSGRIMSKHLPYGYKAHPGHAGQMIEDLAEQEILKTIRELKEKGEGFRGIARELDVLGLPPRDAETWDHSTVRRVLARD